MERGFSRAPAYRAMKDAETEKLLNANASGLLEVPSEVQMELEPERVA